MILIGYADESWSQFSEGSITRGAEGMLLVPMPINRNNPSSRHGCWKFVETAPVVVAFIVAFIVITGTLGCLWWTMMRAILCNESNDRETTDVVAGGMLLATWLIVIVIGTIVLNHSKPYSATWTGRLIAWLGIGVMLVSLAALVAITRVLVLGL